MGSQKWNRAGQYAAAGASTGAAIGSLVPGYGTLIGGAIGGLVGGIGGYLGGSAEDDNDARRLETQIQQTEQDKARAKKDAYEQFLLNTGAQLMSGGGRGAAGAALGNYAAYRGQLRDLDRQGTAYEREMHNNYDRMTAYDPNTTVQLGLSLANVAGQGAKALNKPVSPPLSAEQFQALGNRPAAPVDMGISPEVDINPDPENLQALRRGRRMGF